MPFAEKLAQLRKRKNLTQQETAALIGVGVAQIRRYEKGNSSPTLEVIKNMAKTLGVSADELIFDEDEKVASGKIMDKELLEQFELISQLDPHDVDAIKTILDSMIIKSRLEEVMPPTRKDATWTKEMRSAVDDLRKGTEPYSWQEIEDLVDEAVLAVRQEERKGREKVGA